MKYTWSIKDIRSGMIVVKQTEPPERSRKEILDYYATIMYQVGYLAGDGKRCLISICDGSIVSTSITVEEMANHFNTEGFAPVTFGLYLEVIQSLRDRIIGER